MRCPTCGASLSLSGCWILCNECGETINLSDDEDEQREKGYNSSDDRFDGYPEED